MIYFPVGMCLARFQLSRDPILGFEAVFVLLLGVSLLLPVTLGGWSPGPELRAESQAPKNLFINGSFEQGRNPWFALVQKNWEGFSITDRHAKHGRHSAHLELRASVSTEGTKVFGLIQEVSPKEFPKRISGFYRVENWKRGTPKQYLQFVVIIWEDPNEKRFPNYQIRYILAGVDTPPLRIGNARYVLLGIGEPKERLWIEFNRDVRADFERLWGRVPSGFSKIRVLFEARYDQKKAGDGEVMADVYYDDLYFGE